MTWGDVTLRWTQEPSWNTSEIFSRAMALCVVSSDRGSSLRLSRKAACELALLQFLLQYATLLPHGATDCSCWKALKLDSRTSWSRNSNETKLSAKDKIDDKNLFLLPRKDSRAILFGGVYRERTRRNFWVEGDGKLRKMRFFYRILFSFSAFSCYVACVVVSPFTIVIRQHQKGFFIIIPLRCSLPHPPTIAMGKCALKILLYSYQEQANLRKGIFVLDSSESCKMWHVQTVGALDYDLMDFCEFFISSESFSQPYGCENGLTDKFPSSIMHAQECLIYS